VLKLDRVGRHDNFFSLGGHSLLTVRIVAMLEQIGISILVTDLFAHPSIESLAEYIGTKQGSERGITAIDEAIPIRKAGIERPLFLVHTGAGPRGSLYFSVLAPYIDIEIPVYGLPPRKLNEAPCRRLKEWQLDW
jgi:arthrofactin-type cyclic lipopeptide synthetase C